MKIVLLENKKSDKNTKKAKVQRVMANLPSVLSVLLAVGSSRLFCGKDRKRCRGNGRCHRAATEE